MSYTRDETHYTTYKSLYVIQLNQTPLRLIGGSYRKHRNMLLSKTYYQRFYAEEDRALARFVQETMLEKWRHS